MSTWLYRTRFVLLLLVILIAVMLTTATQQPVRAVDRAVQTVASFTLINASQDTVITTLQEDYVINCHDLGTVVLNIRANTSPATVGSVKFGLDDNPDYRIENTKPYSLAGNNNGDYNGWRPVNGSHTVTATPYTGSNATGTAGTALTIHIVAAQCVTPTATPTFTATQPVATDTPTTEPTITTTSMATSTATLTPGVTDSPTATSTDAPATATVTPTATATDISVSELVVNGGFEIDTDGDKIPDGWILKNVSKDKRKCNNPPKIVAQSGECAFQFKGVSGENSKLHQIITPAQIAPITLDSGDSLALTGYIYAKGSVNALIKIRVKYTDTTLQPGKITLNINAPHSTYTAFGDLSSELTYQLVATPNKIKVLLGNKGISGKTRFDAISLLLTDNASSLIPLP